MYIRTLYLQINLTDTNEGTSLAPSVGLYVFI